LMAAKKYKYGMTGNLYRLSQCSMHFDFFRWSFFFSF
jgi:hypothetical protein